MDHGAQSVITQLAVGQLELSADNWVMMFNVRNINTQLVEFYIIYTANIIINSFTFSFLFLR